jgi:hypothetical protein
MRCRSTPARAARSCACFVALTPIAAVDPSTALAEAEKFLKDNAGP